MSDTGYIKYYSHKELAAVKSIFWVASIKGSILKLHKIENQENSIFLRKRKTRGGGQEVHYDFFASMPEFQADIKKHYLHQKMVEETKLPIPLPKSTVTAPSHCVTGNDSKPKPARDIVKIDVTSLKDRQRDVMAARLFLLNEFKNYECDPVNPANLYAQQELAKSLCSNLIIANDRSSNTCRISVRTFINWRSLWLNHGKYALAPKLSRKKEPIPEWFFGYLKFYARPAKPKMAEALRSMERFAKKQNLTDMFIPTYEQVRN
ncbi:MAG: hypothetical protein HRU28_03380 [Rhizobiales bacterium]|nr:hypothetical protein [Hyphomicrobiales bacterium]